MKIYTLGARFSKDNSLSVCKRKWVISSFVIFFYWYLQSIICYCYRPPLFNSKLFYWNSYHDNGDSNIYQGLTLCCSFRIEWAHSGRSSMIASIFFFEIQSFIFSSVIAHLGSDLSLLFLPLIFSWCSIFTFWSSEWWRLVQN